jgi:hypothetical protein
MEICLPAMATARQAFSGDTAAIVHEAIQHRTPVPARELNPDLPVQIPEIINKALQKDREFRYQSASHMQDDLTCLKHDPGRALTEPKIARGRFSRLILATIAVLLPAFLAGASYFVRGYLRLHLTPPQQPSMASLEIVPLVALQRAQASPAFSADGNQVAFGGYEGEDGAIYTALSAATNRCG